ncbi:MAG: tRNA threonylcarbamoyladenosine dehydratase [Clostridia bacterium]
MNDLIYQRTEIMLGDITKLKNSHVCICGIGGVGSYAVEALARIGIGMISIIDKDIVDITNINRQIIALHSTVGLDKVKVQMDRIKDINPNTKVNSIKVELNEDNIGNYITTDMDYVVDCVDNVEAKVGLIKFCNNNSIKLISCMGMAKKVNPLDIKVEDIYNTKMCPLAKIIRKRLKSLNILKQKVVFSVESPIVTDGNILRECVICSVCCRSCYC